MSASHTMPSAERYSYSSYSFFVSTDREKVFDLIGPNSNIAVPAEVVKEKDKIVDLLLNRNTEADELLAQQAIMEFNKKFAKTTNNGASESWFINYPEDMISSNSGKDILAEKYLAISLGLAKDFAKACMAADKSDNPNSVMTKFSDKLVEAHQSKWFWHPKNHVYQNLVKQAKLDFAVHQDIDKLLAQLDPVTRARCLDFYDHLNQYGAEYTQKEISQSIETYLASSIYRSAVEEFANLSTPSTQQPLRSAR